MRRVRTRTFKSNWIMTSTYTRSLGPRQIVPNSRQNMTASFDLVYGHFDKLCLLLSPSGMQWPVFLLKMLCKTYCWVCGIYILITINPINSLAHEKCYCSFMPILSMNPAVIYTLAFPRTISTITHGVTLSAVMLKHRISIIVTTQNNYSFNQNHMVM